MRGDDNGYSLTHTVTGNSHVYTQADYNAAIENVAKIMRVPYICMDDIGINRANMYPTYASDSASTPTHPNAAGHKLMAEQLAVKLAAVARGYKEGKA